MPLLNFQPRFAPLVESGKKTQTIRAPRKRPIKVGDRLYLYTGLRTKNVRKLGEGTVTFVAMFSLDGERSKAVPDAWTSIDATLSGYDLAETEYASLQEIAERDGFSGEVPMAEWFQRTHGLPFRGVLIRWRLG